jgi:hypothetical protein
LISGLEENNKADLKCFYQPCDDPPRYIINGDLVCQGHKLTKAGKIKEEKEVNDEIRSIDNEVGVQL